MILQFAKAYAIVAATAAVLSESTKKGLECLQGVLSWIVREELETLKTVIEFLLGKTLLDCIGGKIGVRDTLASLYITVRFMFLGACLGMISGAKMILFIIWIFLFTARLAFRE